MIDLYQLAINLTILLGPIALAALFIEFVFGSTRWNRFH